MDSMLHSCRCPNCGFDSVGPIANVDDVKWSLGNLVLEPLFQHCDLPIAIQAAKEQIEYLDLQKQMLDKMESGLNASFFSQSLRQDIKNLIDKMDQISDGPRRSVDRGYEQLSALQREDNDVVGDINEDSMNEEGAVFPPPAMFSMD